MTHRNAHATCLVVGSQGVMIRGPSGTGKTALALALLDACRGRSIFARFVGDDQVWLEIRGGRLIATVPEAIAGLIEVFGVGPRPADFESRTIIDLVVDLVPPAEVARYQADARCLIEGVDVRHLVVPERQAISSALAILSRLDISPSA